MSVVDKSVKVAKSADDLLQAIVKVAATCKQVTKDGFQAGQDIPPILASVVGELVAVVAEMKDLPADAKEHTVEFVRALSVGAVDIVEAVIS